MKLESGNTYQLAGSLAKVRILCDNRVDHRFGTYCPYVGLITEADGNEVVAEFNNAGICLAPTQYAGLSIVVPEKIEELDWSVIPPWLNWFAVDGGGEQYFYAEKPEVSGCTWIPVGIVNSGSSMEVPEEFKYNVNCDWKDTLTERPT
jgi:hypothetical protein